MAAWESGSIAVRVRFRPALKKDVTFLPIHPFAALQSGWIVVLSIPHAFGFYLYMAYRIALYSSSITNYRHT